MITLAAADTIAAGASAASAVTCTIFGMELNAGTEVFKVLDQRQLAAAPATIYTVPTSNQAFIRSISIVNTSAVPQTFQLFRGGTGAANALIPPLTINAGYTYFYEDELGWRVVDTEGELQQAFGPFIALQNYGITGSLAETLDRNFCPEVNTAALVSQRLQMQAIWLLAGTLITNISFYSATTALATGSNQLFGLYDIDRNRLGVTNNDGATAWGANTIKTLALTTPYTVQRTALHYLGIMVHATTVPTLKGGTAIAATQLRNEPPIIGGSSTTGLTTTLPDPAAAITVQTTNIWGAVG